MPEVKLGHVEDYFAKISVAAIKIDEGELNVGDTVHFKGHTTDLTCGVDSIQLEHKSVNKATAGQSVGIKVSDKVRRTDTVFKLIP